MGKYNGHRGKLQSTESKIYERLCLTVHSWVVKIIKRVNDRLFQLLHQSCSKKCSEELSSASGPSTALLTGSSPDTQALRALGGLEGATGWGETEVPVCTQLLPIPGTQLATSTPMEMSAYSLKAEEGFPHKNFMLLSQRKLKIDGEDWAGTSAQRTQLRSTNCKEGSYKYMIISLSIRCYLSWREWQVHSNQREIVLQLWRRRVTTRIKTTAWHSTAEKEEEFLDLQHYTDLHQGGTTLHKLSHSTAIQKLQGKATRYSPLRHWETTEVIKRLIVSALPQLFLHPKSAEKCHKKLLRVFVNGNIYSL